MYNRIRGDNVKKLFVKTTSIVLVIFIFIFSVALFSNSKNTTDFSEYTYMNNVSLISNAKQAYLVGISGNTVKIDAVYPQKFQRTFDTNLKPVSYRLCDNTIIVLCTQDSRTEFCLFDIDTFEYTSVLTPEFFKATSYDFAYSGGYIYYINNHNEVVKISKNGSLCERFTFERNVQSLAVDKSNNIYCICDKGMYKINTECVKISENNYFAPVDFLSDRHFVDGSDAVYVGNTKIGVFSSYNTRPFAGVIYSHFIAVDKNNIYALDISNCEKKKQFTNDKNIENICVINNKIIALSFSDNVPVITLIDYSELIDIEKKSDITVSTAILSSTYKINNKTCVISNIKNGTTVAKFKKNINFNEYNIKFLRYDNKELTSGNVGTGTTVMIFNDKESFDYKLSVIGDVTGEGNVNTRDMKVIAKHILGTQTLKNEYLLSADIDNNGIIDIVDLAYVAQMYAESKQ